MGIRCKYATSDFIVLREPILVAKEASAGGIPLVLRHSSEYAREFRPQILCGKDKGAVLVREWCGKGADGWKPIPTYEIFSLCGRRRH